MAITICVCNGKGGEGKTTISRELLLAFAAQNFRVSCEDLDPQKTLTRWLEPRGFVPAADPNIVIMDTPPQIDSKALTKALKRSDIVIVPIMPGDVDETAQTLLVIEEAGCQNVLVVRNRVKAGTKSAKQLETMESPYPVADVVLGSFEVFIQARILHKTVAEIEPNSKAAEQVRALVEEIKSRFMNVTASAK